MRKPQPYRELSDNVKVDGTKQKRLLFAVKQGRAEGVNHNSNLFDIMNTCTLHGVDVTKAYMNTFSNGVTCYTYLTNGDVSDTQWSNIKKTGNLVLNLPEGVFVHDYFIQGLYDAPETFYLFATTRFAYYFMQNPNEDFEDLYKHLSDSMSKQRKLVNLKMSLDRENVKVEAIKGTLERHPEIVKFLYKDFQSRM